MRQRLQRNEKFVSHFPELAIVNALDYSEFLNVPYAIFFQIMFLTICICYVNKINRIMIMMHFSIIIESQDLMFNIQASFSCQFRKY